MRCVRWGLAGRVRKMASVGVRQAMRRLAPSLRRTLLQGEGKMIHTVTRAYVVGGVAVARRCVRGNRCTHATDPQPPPNAARLMHPSFNIRTKGARMRKEAARMPRDCSSVGPSVSKQSWEG